MSDQEPYPGTPRWVKAIGITALVSVLLIVFLHLTGLAPSHHRADHQAQLLNGQGAPGHGEAHP